MMKESPQKSSIPAKGIEGCDAKIHTYGRLPPRNSHHGNFAAAMPTDIIRCRIDASRKSVEHIDATTGFVKLLYNTGFLRYGGR